MHVVTAQLPEPPHTDDRVFTTPNALIVLDGASAFVPVPVSASTYVDHLGLELQRRLLDQPDADLQVALSDAIQQTVAALALAPGRSPSSTVAIARVLPAATDVLVLGDSQVVTPFAVLRDDRIDLVATDERSAYRRRLAAGGGYDSDHRALLAKMQHAQRKSRNVASGYSIAEADPSAAYRALTRRFRPHAVPWLALATDGIYRPLMHLSRDRWPLLASMTKPQLHDLLLQCHEWEHANDPRGVVLPRAKVHDDKTLVVARELYGNA